MKLIRVGFNSVNGVNPPIGRIHSRQDGKVPDGWIKCEGQGIDDLSDYPALQNWMIGQGMTHLPKDEDTSQTIITPIKRRGRH